MTNVSSGITRPGVVVFLCFFFGAVCHAYEVPVVRGNEKGPPALEELQKLSRGLARVSNTAKNAIVFVSVAKTVSRPPMLDPWEFFFGHPGPGRQFESPLPKEERLEGVGSGFFIDLNKGYIVTNNHVIEGADEISLKLANGYTGEGKVIGRDANTDLAVIQLKSFPKRGLVSLKFANSDQMALGDFVLAIGAPFGLEASASFGIISSLGRGSLGITELGDFLQTDAAINPGNSGGPLINMAGNVVGVNTAIFSETGVYSGIGFSIPSNLARLVVERLINEGRIVRGYLGASLQPIDRALAEQLELPPGMQGSLIANVVKGSPAAKAGLEPGDVITAVEGDEVRGPGEVVTKVGLMEPGSKVRFTVFRSGSNKQITVALGRWPSPEGEKERPTIDQRQGEHQGEGIGVAVAPVSDTLREQFNVTSEKGLVVLEVTPDSPAARAGIQAGDVILSMNRKEVDSPEELRKAFTKVSSALVRIERQGTFQFVSVTKEEEGEAGLSH